MQHIVFRVDATIELASGHLMRCLTLAAQLKLMLPTVTISFITGKLPNQLRSHLSRTEYTLYEFDHNADDTTWDQSIDSEQTSKLLATFTDIDLLIVDHYHLDIYWEKAIAPYCKKILVIDDLANRQHACDFLLDQTLGRSTIDYLPLVPYSCQLLLGQPFMLLRNEFLSKRDEAIERREAYSQTKTILLNLGGIDPHNATGKLLRYLLDVVDNKALAIRVVMSADAPYLAEIEALSKHNIGIELIINSQNMSTEILNADIAIGACGGTAWERCCLGLPSISVVLADNQNGIAAQLAKQGAHINLGHIDQIDEACLRIALKQIQIPAQYRKMAHNAFNCCDGLGVKRLVKRLVSQEITLAKASPDDMQTLFNWQSNPEVRRYARQSKPVTLAEHQAWFSHSLTLDTRYLYVVYRQDTPVGMLRLDQLSPAVEFDNHIVHYEVSILVAPELQGQGIAQKALLAIPEQFNLQGVYAFVDKRNKASQALFSQANFIRVGTEQFIRPARQTSIT